MCANMLTLKQTNDDERLSETDDRAQMELRRKMQYSNATIPNLNRMGARHTKMI